MPSDDSTLMTAADQLREACAALTRRLHAGEVVRTEDLLTEHPSLAASSECAWELAYTEFVTRDALGQRPDPEEWYARFPQWAGDLRELFDVHRFVHQTAEHTVTLATKNRAIDEQKEPPRQFNEAIDDARRLGNYELLEEIGRGGMGVVYKARQIGVRRIVALKLILAGEHADADRYARFVAEAETVGRLEHANIVQIHEVGVDQGRPYISLEYVAGGGLDRKLAGSPLPFREAAALVETLARAIQHAHERGVVHRDLKPANVLLTADGVPKITDFGLAKRLFDEQSGQTATGALLGTPSYMAPEQASGYSRDSGAAADVYALGAILYELLTGRPPFCGVTILDTLEQVRSHEPVSPSRLQVKLPADLETICLKCLQKSPAHRYASALALADDLRRFLDHMPICARPVGFVGRVARWSQRNPVIATLAAVSAVLAAVVVIASPIVAITQAGLRKDVEDQLQQTRSENRAKTAGLLAANSRLAEEFPIRSLLLAMEGTETHRRAGEAVPVTIEQAVRDALDRTGGVGLVADTPIHSSVVSPDGSLLAVGGRDGGIRIWRIDSVEPLQGATTFEGHSGTIRRMAISPDGRWLVSAADDRTVRLWDLRATDIAASSIELRGHKAGVAVATFSHDGRLLVTADSAGPVQLWRLTGEGSFELSDAYEQLGEAGQRSPIKDAAFSADGHWLAFVGGDAMVRVFEMRNGTFSSPRELTGHTGPLAVAVFSPSGSLLATAGADRTVRLWDLSSANPIADARTLSGHTNMVFCLAFSPDGRWLLSGCVDRTVRRWDLMSDDPNTSSIVLGGHDERIMSIATSGDGHWLASGGNDRTVRLWRLDASDPNETVRVMRGHDDIIQAVAFAGDRRVVSASLDGTARLWDVTEPGVSASSARAYEVGSKVQSLAISSSGRRLACGADDKAVHLWDRQSADSPTESPATHSLVASAQLVAFSPNDRWLAAACSDRGSTPVLWDLSSTDPSTSKIRLTGHKGPIECLLFGHTGDWLATGGGPEDGTVRLWSMPPRVDSHARIVTKHESNVVALAATSDGSILASSAADATVVVASTQLATKDSERRELHGHGGGLGELVIHPSGKWLAVGDADQSIWLWDLQSSAENTSRVQQLSAGNLQERSLTLSADGRWLYAIVRADQVVVWDMNDVNEGHWEQAPTPMDVRGDEGTASKSSVSRANYCTISPDSRWLAVYGADGAVRLWSLGAAGLVDAPIVLRGHSAAIKCADFSPDSRRLITGSYDGTVREWPIGHDELLAHARRVAGRELNREETRLYLAPTSPTAD